MVASTSLVSHLIVEDISARTVNILRSPKRGGSSQGDSQRYLNELGVRISENKQSIQFTRNLSEPIHRWAPYVQGFSASFVQSIFHRYRNEYARPTILDPFAGCGTVLVQAKQNGYQSFGVELNPLLRFISHVKVNSWTLDPGHLLAIYHSLRHDVLANHPGFLKSEKQFGPEVLVNLRRIKGGIDSFLPGSEEEHSTKNLLNVAFASILTDCSNLKRTPCLGYWRGKTVDADAPSTLFRQAIWQIADDLNLIRLMYGQHVRVRSEVVCANSMHWDYQDSYDLAITSPPYMNGLDYVMNYKIEMAWLGFIKSHREAKAIKDQLVVCDNVSKGLIKTFSKVHHYTNEWIQEIALNIAMSIEARGKYRRVDMPWIVRKYFDDMHKVIERVASALKKNGRFILVVGDSLIADTYVPTDLILARIGAEEGLNIESIEYARARRSGQIRDYRLRETVVTLRK